MTIPKADDYSPKTNSYIAKHLREDSSLLDLTRRIEKILWMER